MEKEFSGKGEVKKKKEFDFAEELKKNLPEQLKSGSNPPPTEQSILSLLGKIAPDKVKAVAQGLATLQGASEQLTGDTSQAAEGGDDGGDDGDDVEKANKIPTSEQ